MRFSRRPVEVEAIQVTPSPAVLHFLRACVVEYRIGDDESGVYLLARTSDGQRIARRGDWFVKDRRGLHLVPAAEFLEDFSPVEGAPDLPAAVADALDAHAERSMR